MQVGWLNLSIQTKGIYKMTNTQLTKVLEQHGIAFEVLENKVMVQDEYSIDGTLHSDTVDMTGISPEQLYDWLGY